MIPEQKVAIARSLVSLTTTYAPSISSLKLKGDSKVELQSFNLVLSVSLTELPTSFLVLCLSSYTYKCFEHPLESIHSPTPQSSSPRAVINNDNEIPQWNRIRTVGSLRLSGSQTLRFFIFASGKELSLQSKATAYGKRIPQD